MKITLSILIFIFLICNKVYSNEIDCSKFKKLSAKYLECNANKLKNKTGKTFKKGKKKYENSGIKDKLKSFKDSKTLKDLIKN
tara:strand:+ start:464 stop:712 length:249 start_codon:yes stop_codon:yes gene_type:complete